MENPKIKEHLINANNSKLKYVSLISLGFSGFALFTDFMIHGVWRNEYLHIYKVLDIVFAVISVSSVSFFWLFKIKTITRKRVGIILFPFLFLIWSAVITGVDFSMLGFSTFIIVVLFITFFLFLSPIVSIAYFSGAFIALMTTLYFTRQLNDNYLSIIFLVIPTVTISVLITVKNYKNKLNDLFNKQEIEKMNKKLNDSNKNLEREVEKRTEEILIALKKAEESDRLKTAFLSNISHEIRTPLNAILGFSELLQNTTNSQEEIRFFLEQIQYGKDDLLDLIENVVFASKIDAHQYVSIKNEFNLNECLNKLVADSKKLIQRKDKSNIKVVSHYDSANDTIIESDEKNMITALRQLLSNAVKYTDAGEIEIGTKIIDDCEAELYIRDTGIGIDANEYEKIFDRFYKVESNPNKLFRGAGIGLTIVKGIADNMGGRVWVDSKVGQGSTFFFRFPVRVIKGMPVYSHPERVASNITERWGERNILIAEDVDTNFRYLDKALGFCNITRFHARNGQEAIEIMKSAKIDLVLMDIIMPVIDGYEAASIIKTIYPSIPIIAQTAIYDNNDKDIDLTNIFDDYLIKPIKINTLIEVLNKYLKTDN
jgi:signal transduction histidine kinase